MARQIEGINENDNASMGSLLSSFKPSENDNVNTVSSYLPPPDIDDYVISKRTARDDFHFVETPRNVTRRKKCRENKGSSCSSFKDSLDDSSSNLENESSVLGISHDPLYLSMCRLNVSKVGYESRQYKSTLSPLQKSEDATTEAVNLEVFTPLRTDYTKDEHEGELEISHKITLRDGFFETSSVQDINSTKIETPRLVNSTKVDTPKRENGLFETKRIQLISKEDQLVSKPLSPIPNAIERNPVDISPDS